jgi:hypothetical protein
MKRHGIQAMLGMAAGALAVPLISTAPAQAIPATDTVDDLNEIVAADQASIQSLVNFDDTLITSAQAQETTDINAGFVDFQFGDYSGALHQFDMANLVAIDTNAMLAAENSEVFGSIAALFPASFFDAFQPG